MSRIWEMVFTVEGEAKMCYLTEKLGLSRCDVIDRALVYYRALLDEKDKGCTVLIDSASGPFVSSQKEFIVH